MDIRLPPLPRTRRIGVCSPLATRRESSRAGNRSRAHQAPLHAASSRGIRHPRCWIPRRLRPLETGSATAACGLACRAHPSERCPPVAHAEFFFEQTFGRRSRALGTALRGWCRSVWLAVGRCGNLSVPATKARARGVSRIRARGALSRRHDDAVGISWRVRRLPGAGGAALRCAADAAGRTSSLRWARCCCSSSP